jgi:hypothetical protein
MFPFFQLMQTNSAAWVYERTIPTEGPPIVGEGSAKFEDRKCHVISVTDSYCIILEFLDPSRFVFFQVAPQLYSRGWVDPVPEPLLLRKSGSAGNRTLDLWICGQELWPLDHRGAAHFRMFALTFPVASVWD